MKKLSLLFLLSCLGTAGQGQQVSVTKSFAWAAEEANYALTQTPDGGYLLGGNTTSFNSTYAQNAYLLKTDRNGDSLWIKHQYSATAMTDIQDILPLADGTILVAGAKSTPGNNWDAWLMKTDASGNMLWERTFGGAQLDYFSGLQAVPGGGFVMCGLTESMGAGGRDAYLVKTDAGGNLLWEKTYGGSFLDEVIKVKVTQNGDFIMAGGTYSFSSNPGVTDDLYLIRTDPQGNQRWHQTYGTANIDWANDLVETPTGEIVLTGLKNNSNLALTSGQTYLLKTDASGNLLWDKSFSLNAFRNEGQAILTTPDGGLLISGFTTNPMTGTDAFVVKTDADGTILWQHIFDNGAAQTFERAYGLLQDDQGKILISGMKNFSPTLQPDIFLLKLTDNAVLGIAGNQKTEKLALTPFPNPASGSLSVKVPYTKLLQAEILDLTGKVLLTRQFESTTELNFNVAALPPACYLLKVKTAEGVAVSKFLVSR
ncbi:T9SS type A sorting domain-containing protein [Adhaeribacter soli]|uniref:T9SS type A sorting domain-containing protein n=1 Tax=Adhaeribacter soli TaxID=2607655 RepID=A0A5N1JAN5_9BACT|nr:T9SS type A sorting domain-containing protein [Adhaeribacter soli]KAA9346078.1 T9SS type A sorting domain-containing protein [Adhaeribacter soli]